MEPEGGGMVTGLAFEGRARLTLAPSTDGERRQLARFSGMPEGTLVDDAERMVLRFSGPACAGPPARSEPGPLAPVRWVTALHEEWLEMFGVDVDARVVRGMLVPGADYCRAALKTKHHGWLVVEIDRLRPEVFRVERLFPRTGLTEVWVSEPMPAADVAAADVVDLQHADITAVVEPNFMGDKLGKSATRTVKATFTVTLTLTAARDGLRALPLWLDPAAKVSQVSTGTGEVLSFLRYPRGPKFASVDDRVFAPDLTILLKKAVSAGQELAVTVTYDMELANYVSGRLWYPGAMDPLGDPHTATLRIDVPETFSVRATGDLVASTEAEGGRKTTRWAVARPSRLVAFTFGKKFYEHAAPVADGAEVIAFGVDLGVGGGDAVTHVAQDVAASLKFYQDLLGISLPARQLWATSIAAPHGQAFDGLLQLSERTFYNERAGVSTLFRAHETAHQFFGLGIGWSGYRDQWLSESLSEYAAMMFLADKYPEERYFEEILDVYAAQLTGSINSAGSPFARPGLIRIPSKFLARLGPIGVGYRADTADLPAGYFMQTYHKGPWVLHMLRAILERDHPGAFVAVLRELVQTFWQQRVSTANFAAIAEKHAKADLGWFFSEWIDGTAIPTYRWKWRLLPPPAAGPRQLELMVRQERAPEDFRMPVPVCIEYDDGENQLEVVTVSGETTTAVLPVRAAPTDVELACGRAVLAVVKER